MYLHTESSAAHYEDGRFRDEGVIRGDVTKVRDPRLFVMAYPQICAILTARPCVIASYL